MNDVIVFVALVSVISVAGVLLGNRGSALVGRLAGPVDGVSGEERPAADILAVEISETQEERRVDP